MLVWPLDGCYYLELSFQICSDPLPLFLVLFCYSSNNVFNSLYYACTWMLSVLLSRILFHIFSYPWSLGFCSVFASLILSLFGSLATCSLWFICFSHLHCLQLPCISVILYVCKRGTLWIVVELLQLLSLMLEVEKDVCWQMIFPNFLIVRR